MYAAGSYYEVEEERADIRFAYNLYNKVCSKTYSYSSKKLPDGLSIDGVSKETECSLNPILHIDILNKAFELAVSTRGGGTVQRQQNNDNQRNLIL